MKQTKATLFSAVLFIVLPFLVMTTTEAIVIHQVLYDPVQESGSEAIELFNDADQMIDISGWKITTENNDPDAVVPNATFMESHSFFLIADKSWSTSRDNLSWPLADYEEALTISNTNSGISVKNRSGDVVDTVAWGSSNKFGTGTTTKHVAQGIALIRTQNTHENNADFLHVPPSFTGSHGTYVLLDVPAEEQALNVSLQEDDDSVQGIQIKPIPGKIRTLHIRAQGTIEAPELIFQGKTTTMTKKNATEYSGTIEMPFSASPDTYTVLVQTGSLIRTLEFEYLALQAWDVHPKNIRVRARPGEVVEQTLTVINTGNVLLTVSPRSLGLRSMTGAVGTDLTPEQQIAPQMNASIALKMTVPQEARGTYTGSVLFEVS